MFEKIKTYFEWLIDDLTGRWKPKPCRVYKSWTKMPWVRANEQSFEVLITIENEDYPGSFSVGNKWCEIRTKKYKLIVPKQDVIFDKQVRYFNSIKDYGQSGGAGKIIIYTAKVRKIGEGEKRFRDFKKK